MLHEATTGASRTRRRNHPMSRPPFKRTGLELELTKRTDREEHHLLRLPFIGDHFSVLLSVFKIALIFLSSTE